MDDAQYIVEWKKCEQWGMGNGTMTPPLRIHPHQGRQHWPPARLLTPSVHAADSC